MRGATAFVIVLAATTPAVAAPDDIVGRPLVLARDEIGADLTLEYNLAPEQPGVPLSIAPDLWWGVSPRWTLGVIHSNASIDQIQPGASVCLHTRDIDGLCDRAYHGSGLDARWSWLDTGAFAIAPRARFLLRDVDPWRPALTVGALARWHHGRFAITGDPFLQIGLARTDVGNRARLVLPVYLALQPIQRIELAVQTGFQSDLAVIRDGWHVPLGLRATLRASHGFDLVVEAGFASALGPQNDVKQRTLFVTLGWRSGR